MAAPTSTTPGALRPKRLFATLVAIPTGRWTKWVVLALWLVVVAAVSPIAGQLSDVEENDPASFLPENAESLQVAKLQEQFPSADTSDAIVIYHRDGGLTPADQAQIEADRQTIAGRFPQVPLGPPIPSEDGVATIYSLSFSTVEEDTLPDDIEALRDLLGDGGDGLEIKVTGPAGFLVDLIEVFGAIDTTLLLATASVVAVLLLITYRSPFLWLVPLLVVACANQSATASVYGLAKYAGITVNGQSSGILPILVFGAGTDYALLLIARYREELREHEDKHEAMAFALRRAGPAVIASGGTVVLGLLCLLAANLNSNRGLGPVGAAGIVAALLAMLTLLPAVLVIFGRRLFWPFVPRFGSASHEESGLWTAVGNWVDRRPRPIWIGTVLLLGVFALGLLAIDTNLPQEDQFRTSVESIEGQELIAASYPAGSGQPTTIIAGRAAADAVQTAIAETSGVVDVRQAEETDALVSFAATFDTEPGSQATFDTIERLRDRVHAVDGANALVGGNDAANLDVAKASVRDQRVIVPLILVVVLVILAILLRAIVAPLVLIATVVLSFAAALGASILVFDYVFGFAGMDPSIPLLGFVFLVALGIDYNIFLMSRVHEEAAYLGTRQGMLKGLAVTGGVITSAGIVLAATFAVLGVLPLVTLTEIGFIVAFGVLLDTVIVRSVLVPALTLDIGRRIWWPSRLARPNGQTHHS